MLLKTRRTPPIKTKLQNATISNFTGGWNAVDDDVNLSTRFSVISENMRRGTNDNQVARFGTDYFADVSSVVSGDLLNIAYYKGRLISVTDEGEVASVNGNGTPTAIWNTTIAAFLPGAPSGWTNPIVRANFVPHKTELIIHNGLDKPLQVDENYAVTYLQDPATGSNANVPIGKFATVVGNYHVVAGIVNNPTLVYIASVGTSGVFPGDPIPNDSISFDVGAYSPSQSDEIRGIHTYRNQLIIFFTEAAILFQLGEYDESSVHTPISSDEVPAFGLLGQRAAVSMINDLIFMDISGVNSAKRNLFAGLIDTKRVSDLIAPAYQGNWTDHTSNEQQDETFALYNKLDNEVMLFDTAGSKTFTLTFGANFRKRTWSSHFLTEPNRRPHEEVGLIMDLPRNVDAQRSDAEQASANDAPIQQ